MEHQERSQHWDTVDRERPEASGQRGLCFSSALTDQAGRQDAADPALGATGFQHMKLDFDVLVLDELLGPLLDVQCLHQWCEASHDAAQEMTATFRVVPSKEEGSKT